MIKANEFRIGNKVTDEWYESFKTIITVESINDKGINLAIEDDGNYPECAQTWIEPEDRLDNLFGIPLTEEILLKCGFEKDGPFFDLSMFTLRNFKDEWIVYHFKRELIRINYLHHLQNIYWCLCGQELEVNL